MSFCKKLTFYIKHYVKSVKEALNEPTTYFQLYKFGLIVILLAFVSVPLLEVMRLDAYMPYVFFTAYIGVLCIAIGFCWEMLLWINEVLKKSVVASIVLGLPSSAFVTSISTVVAEQLINDATGILPHDYKNSINIITVLSVPIVLAYFLAFLLFFYHVLSVIVTFIRFVISFANTRLSKKTSFYSISMLRPFAALIVALHIIIGLSSIPDSITHKVTMLTNVIVGLTDHYEYGAEECKEPLKNHRYRLLSNNQVSIVNGGNSLSDISFTIASCDKL